MGLLETKKAEKRQKLLDSAYRCFSRKGISATSISDICEGAGVAKGTFYLYFKDREDIAKTLNTRITQPLLQESFQYMLIHPKDTFAERLIVMADYLMDRFEKDHDLILIIRRDFSWPLREEEILDGNARERIPGFEEIEAYAKESGRPLSEVLLVIYCLVAMVISVSYDAIIEKTPAQLSLMRPVIRTMIRSSLA